MAIGYRKPSAFGYWLSARMAIGYRLLAISSNKSFFYRKSSLPIAEG